MLGRPFLTLMPIGHRATNGSEPRQVRKEAAVRIAVCVVVHSNQAPEGERLSFSRFEKGCTAKGLLFVPIQFGIWSRAEVAAVRYGPGHLKTTYFSISPPLSRLHPLNREIDFFLTRQVAAGAAFTAASEQAGINHFIELAQGLALGDVVQLGIVLVGYKAVTC